MTTGGTSDEAAAPRRVLLTGAAGRIGTNFRREMGGRYRLRLGIGPRDDPGETDGHEVMSFDIADPDACRVACREIDTVVHLAADPSPAADFYGSLLDNNIKGTYNVFRAAKDEGCRRVVFASSIHAVVGYPPDTQARTDMPPRPANMYGVSKCFGEAVAHVFAHTEGLSSIAIRIGAYDAEWLRRGPGAPELGAFVSHRDLNQLLVRCIEVPAVRFAIVHGVSDNRYKRLDLASTRELLGYEPRDDAFKIFGDDLPRIFGADPLA